MRFAQQSDFDIRFEWGIEGVRNVANPQPSDASIIVDILSFSTCVDIACSRQAQVLPYSHNDDSSFSYAQTRNALLASKRLEQGYSLSPRSLLNIEAGTRLVLPSPNGATLSLACNSPIVLAGSLRNAAAVAHYAQRHAKTITLIAAGERWNDGSLRPAIEDLVGAGAIIHYLSGKKSPEARLAEQAFLSHHNDLSALLVACASAIELSERGFAFDVALALELNVSTAVPRLYDSSFFAAE
jgi:2-phosphosulfolactate phosphatase